MSLVKPRILAIRGGAIGDFVLTLPAIRLLRETFAHCHLEILGYEHIASMAVQGGPAEGLTYADEVRNIEAGPLAGFFARNGNLSPEWSEYFGSFNQVVSWLFDPDEIFETNVKRAGVKHYISAYAKINDEAHASVQLARGLERLALYLEEPGARLVPSVGARKASGEWLGKHAMEVGTMRAVVAMHPGSGSAKKNWPVAKWRALGERLKAEGRKVLLVGGEADEATLEALKPLTDFVARGLPLPVLAAILSECGGFYGHDSGVSHLAAAAGVPCTLIFGPTDPAVWAPQGKKVRVVQAPEGELGKLEVAAVVVGE